MEIKIEVSTNSAIFFLAELVDISAPFVADTYSIDVAFLKTFEWDNSVKVARKEGYDRLVCPLMDFVTRQHAWLSLLHAKA